MRKSDKYRKYLVKCSEYDYFGLIFSDPARDNESSDQRAEFKRIRKMTCNNRRDMPIL